MPCVQDTFATDAEERNYTIELLSRHVAEDPNGLVTLTKELDDASTQIDEDEASQDPADEASRPGPSRKRTRDEAEEQRDEAEETAETQREEDWYRTAQEDPLLHFLKTADIPPKVKVMLEKMVFHPAELNWNSALVINLEKALIFKFGLPRKFRDRGPPPPEEGGPTTWRHQRWRKSGKRWGNRGGQNIDYYNFIHGISHRKSKGDGKRTGKSKDTKGNDKNKGAKGNDKNKGKGVK